MRILRGKSNLEVSSQGFALFVVGLVLATFLGGAVRTILSSDRVHQRIVTELQSRFPKNEFHIGQTEVLLSRGIWPGLGLRLKDVVFKQDVCGKLSFVLTIPQLVLPVDILSLRHGRVRLGRVEVDDGQMHLDYRDCPPKTVDPMVAAEMKMPSQGIRSAVSQSGIRPLHLDWKEISRNLKALDLKNFSVTYERNLTWKALFKRAYFELDEDMNMQAAVDLQKSLPFGTLNHTLELDAHGDQQSLTWNFGTDFKEGQISLKGNWDLTSNSARVIARLTQLPLKELSSELYQMGFADREIKMKTAWLTCGALWEGQLAHVEDMPVRLSACKLEGAYGRVDMEQADLFLNQPQPFKVPAVFKVQKLQIQPLVESLGRQVLPTVLARLGIWTGAVSYGGRELWQMDGFLENAEIVFSNQSVRGKQTVRSMRTLVQRSGGAVDLSLVNISLQDGEFQGHMEAHLSEDWRSGAFNVDVERLSLSPSVQALLVGGSIRPARIRGQGRLENGELAAFSGQVAIPEVIGEGWRTEAINVSAKYSPGLFGLDAKALRAEADSHWRSFGQLQGMREGIGDSLVWKDLAARLEISGKGGTVSGFSGTEIGRNKIWRAKGTWVRDGNLTGVLLVGSGAHAQTYALRGEKGLISILDRNPSESQ